MRKVKTLYVPELYCDPFWQEDIIEQVGDRHDLSVYDASKPVAPQFDGVEVVVDSGGRGTREMMDAAGDCKLWQIVSSGVDHCDIEYMRHKGFMMTYCPGAHSSVALAECAMMFMLLLARTFNKCQDFFQDRKLYAPMVGDVAVKTVLIIGFGASGQALARRAKAFDMRVLGIDVRRIDQDVIDDIGPDFMGTTDDDLDRLLPECDYLSLHLHLHEKTRHIIDADRLGLMKKTACFVNVARGGLVDEKALHDALLNGRLAGAGIDVHDPEPSDPNLPVYQLPNVYVSPHVAGETFGTAVKRHGSMVENIDRFAEGREILNRIDQQLPV